eukprot:gene8481-10422_t
MSLLLLKTLWICWKNIFSICLDILVKLSDSDTRFTSKFWTEFFRVLNVKLGVSLPYHHQANGLAKRNVQTVKLILWKMLADNQHGLNIILGRHPYTPLSLVDYDVLPINIPNARDRIVFKRIVLANVRELLRVDKRKMKIRSDLHKKGHNVKLIGSKLNQDKMPSGSYGLTILHPKTSIE